MIPALLISILTAHFDNSRQNSNPSETVLSGSTVVPGKFGRIAFYAVDGAVYAQPLIVSGTLVAATMHGSVYSFNVATGAQLWRFSGGAPRTSYPSTGSNLFYGAELGCLATPVSDGAAAVYAVCASPASWVLYKLSLGGSLLASVTVSAAGFDPTRELARLALTLANGRVYFGFSSFDDSSPWHGWLFAYDAASLAQVAAVNITPNTNGGGVWHSGGGAAVDSAGNLYVTTGNGGYDGVTEFGNSILKFSPNLALLDWFTPANYVALAANDQDLASGQPMMIPGTDLVIFGAKDYNVYSVHTGCMGHLGGTIGGCAAPQIFPTNPAGTNNGASGVYGGMFMSPRVYMPNTAGSIYAFTLAGSTFNTTPTLSPAYSYPGAQLSGANGIVWAVTAAGSAESAPQHGTLRALDAASVAELWNSDLRSSDSLGTMAKFQTPVIADGRVYVGTLDGLVQVYGLIPSASVRGQAVIRGQSVVR